MKRLNELLEKHWRYSYEGSDPSETAEEIRALFRTLNESVIISPHGDLPNFY